MKAAQIHELGGPPTLDEVESPRGETLRILLSALNPLDVSIANGRFYGGTPTLPYTIGSEAIGVLDGRRVWARGTGMMADRAIAEPGAVAAVPAGVADDQAIAAGIGGLTGWLAVSWRAPVSTDDVVLVLGATGTAGSAALQGAAVLGARSIFGAGRPHGAPQLPAGEFVDINGDAFPPATVIVDFVWGEPLQRALAAAAPGVRVVQIGQSSSPVAELQSAWVRGKMANILGLSIFALPGTVAEEGYQELCDHIASGDVRFATRTFAREDLRAAWDVQVTGSPRAKICVSWEAA